VGSVVRVLYLTFSSVLQWRPQGKQEKNVPRDPVWVVPLAASVLPDVVAAAAAPAIGPGREGEQGVATYTTTHVLSRPPPIRCGPGPISSA
jgi:hypothetical protein